MLEIRSKKNQLWPFFNLDKAAPEKEFIPSPAHVAPEEGAMQIVEVPMHQIIVNPYQPRKLFKDEELTELAASIRDYGVLQPIILRPWDENRFLLIAGERRYRASCLVGLDTIPAVIRDLQEEEAALVALVENVQREDLNYIEEARAYKKLMDDFNLTQGEIAKKVGKQQSTISNKIRILTLPEEIQEALTTNSLTERHARALLKLPGETDRKKVIERVVRNNLNVKQTEKLVEDVLAGLEKQQRKKKRIGCINYKIYVNTIRKAFSQVKEMESNAIYTQEDRGDCLELRILIPKNDRCFT